MKDYVTLLGAEEVTNAASSIRYSANIIHQAALNMDSSNAALIQYLSNFQITLENLNEKLDAIRLALGNK